MRGSAFRGMVSCVLAVLFPFSLFAADSNAAMVIRSSRFGVLHLKFYGRQMEYSSSLNRRKEISLIPSGADGLEIR